MAKYVLNKRGYRHAMELIDARHYVVRSNWTDSQPNADAQNRFLDSHSWDEYASWHLGLTVGPKDETKARYAFVFGDLRRLHRSAIIACYFRAAEWGHEEIYQAAHRLLLRLDKVRSTR
jgi:hypothetical protein